MKRLLAISIILLLCCNIGLATDREKCSQQFYENTNTSKNDSLFVIESFVVNDTLLYSYSNLNRIKVDSLSGLIMPLSSGIDTVHVKTRADSTLVASLIVKVASILPQTDVNEPTDKWEIIKDYGLSFIAIALLAVLIWSFIKSRRRKNKITQLRNVRDELKGENSKLKQDIRNREIENLRLSNENQKLENEKRQTEPHRIEIERVMPPIHEEITESVPKSNKLYAASINDGYFFRITDMPNEDTIFELTKGDGRNATFTIYHGVQERVKARPTLIEGCDVQKLSNSPSALEVESGIAQEEDGQWKILTKAKVKFV
jgi:hypothetical protein